MKSKLNILGQFKDADLEAQYLEQAWNKNKNYTFITYFACCFFMVFAGIFGDYKREFFSGSANQLLVLRLFLVLISVSFYFKYKNSKHHSKYTEWWMDAMKFFGAFIIVLLTIWTKGRSLTLLPGIMMIVASYYVILPGRYLFTLLTSVMLFYTFAFLSDAQETFGLQVHKYMSFMLFAIITLLLFFKVKIESWARIEFFQGENLKELSKAKDKILATIAHDIKGPLSIIMNRALQVKRIGTKLEDEKIVKKQESIIGETKKLDGLLSDLVSWAFNEMHDGPLQTQKDCITKSLDDALNFVSEMANEKEIRIVKNVSPKDIDHDRKMMATCFRNILSNAIKFSPTGSEIKIHQESSGDDFTIKIQDHGPGISEEQIQNILKGVNAESKDGSQGEKGTGLGLKLVHNLVSRHQGKFNIQSKVGEGAVFSISFPLEN